jgi:hypothetical protein
MRVEPGGVESLLRDIRCAPPHENPSVTQNACWEGASGSRRAAWRRSPCTRRRSASLRSARLVSTAAGISVESVRRRSTITSTRPSPLYCSRRCWKSTGLPRRTTMNQRGSAAESGTTRSPGMREKEGQIEKPPGKAPAPQERGRVSVCQETGRRRRLTSQSLGPPSGGPVERDRRVRGR